MGWFKRREAKEPQVLVGDPRLDGLETVETFGDEKTAVAWRDQLRHMGINASCAADHPLDRWGRGDIYLVVPSDEWSRANEIVENIE
jgi:4-hydroxyphenylpyruvate dioxygenase-like putative hemolysin